MTEVFVDVGAASIESAAPTEGTPPVDPEALRALRHLAEAGVDVFVVTGGGVQPSPELRAAAIAVLPSVPKRPSAPAFYLTCDIERCQGSSARLRTILIGGAPPNSSVRRCDAVARDVQAAAMEILVADAMPSGVR
ncbi:MAG TPA: hypothetical protein VNL94_00175 [Candidatus Binatia bacterium]|nr:hypothetical protein [Candidatus Binatia bacterium]